MPEENWQNNLVLKRKDNKKKHKNESQGESDQIWSILIKFDQIWSKVVFDHIWSDLIKFDQNWSELIRFDQIWFS